MAATDNAQRSVVESLEKARDELDKFLDHYYQIWLADHDPNANVLENKVRSVEKENAIRTVFLKEWANKIERINQLLRSIQELEIKREQEKKVEKEKQLLDLITFLKTQEETKSTEVKKSVELEKVIWEFLVEKIKVEQNRITALKGYINRLEKVKANYINHANNFIHAIVTNAASAYKMDDGILKLDFLVANQYTTQREVNQKVSININMKEIEDKLDQLIISLMIDGVLDNDELKKLIAPQLNETVKEEIHKALMQQYPGLSQPAFNEYYHSIEKAFTTQGHYNSINNRIDEMFNTKNAELIAKAKYCQLKAKSLDEVIDKLHQTLEKAQDHLALIEEKADLLTKDPDAIVTNFEPMLDEINLDAMSLDNGINLEALAMQMENDAILDEDSMNKLLADMSGQLDSSLEETMTEGAQATTNLLFKTFGIDANNPRTEYLADESPKITEKISADENKKEDTHIEDTSPDHAPKLK